MWRSADPISPEPPVTKTHCITDAYEYLWEVKLIIVIERKCRVMCNVYLINVKII